MNQEIVYPLEHEETATDFYRENFETALKNNEHVTEFIKAVNTHAYSIAIDSTTTEVLDNIIHHFHTSMIHEVNTVEHYNDEFDKMQDLEGELVVHIDLKPRDVTAPTISSDVDDWTPLHPSQLQSSNKSETMTECFARLFGGEPEEYIVEDNEWLEIARQE